MPQTSVDQAFQASKDFFALSDADQTVCGLAKTPTEQSRPILALRGSAWTRAKPGDLKEAFTPLRRTRRQCLRVISGPLPRASPNSRARRDFSGSIITTAEPQFLEAFASHLTQTGQFFCSTRMDLHPPHACGLLPTPPLPQDFVAAPKGESSRPVRMNRFTAASPCCFQDRRRGLEGLYPPG